MEQLNDIENYIDSTKQIFKDHELLFQLPIINFLHLKNYNLLQQDWLKLTVSDAIIEGKELQESEFIDRLIDSVANGTIYVSPFNTNFIILIGFPIFQPEYPSTLANLIQSCHASSLQSWYKKEEHKDRYQQQNFVNKIRKKYLTKMNPKKIHEVGLMSQLIGDICKKNEINSMVDIGSGQGYLTRLTSYENKIEVIGLDGDSRQTIGAKKIDEQYKKWDNIQTEHFTLIINQENYEEFHELVGKQINEKPFLISGLHTCGYLAYSILDLFLKSNANALVSVPCCYNKLLPSLNGCFEPRSKFLQKKEFKIDRLGLKMACQSPFNWSQNKRNCYEFFKRHFYRAMLQELIYTEGYKNENEEIESIGKMSMLEYANFSIYCHSSFKRLKLAPLPTEEVIQSYYLKNLKYYNTIALLWSCQALLAPLIESVLLLDRYLILQEEGCEVDLIPLFDLLVSPRAFALVATKKK
ncbi:hypothetical protein K502DRAFT_322165 [Neoconidiobolus thromboides FSU 785]|nr:hypothetical protein K502DRAFT_322165 [Neoconidiobolus thromboides FSU 785]